MERYSLALAVVGMIGRMTLALMDQSEAAAGSDVDALAGLAEYSLAETLTVAAACFRHLQFLSAMNRNFH